MGDFYEMFYEDAIRSEILGITLTSRDKNAEDPVPMAGIPWHSVEDYLRKMVQSGHKVTVVSKHQSLFWREDTQKSSFSSLYSGSLYEDS